jgi:two-component system response regulator FixJ
MTTTVYIVDDDAAIRAALSLLLTVADLQPVAYADGASFLEDCSQDKSGCVLLDVGMTGMDGYEVLATMQARGICMPVIFLTGHGDRAMALKAAKAGAVGFLPKPIQGNQLIECIRNAMSVDK